MKVNGLARTLFGVAGFMVVLVLCVGFSGSREVAAYDKTDCDTISAVCSSENAATGNAQSDAYNAKNASTATYNKAYAHYEAVVKGMDPADREYVEEKLGNAYLHLTDPTTGAGQLYSAGSVLNGQGDAFMFQADDYYAGAAWNDAYSYYQAAILKYDDSQTKHSASYNKCCLADTDSASAQSVLNGYPIP